MTLALGLAAAFIGAASVIAGISDRPIGRLLFGYWDAPGSGSKITPPPTSAPGNAQTGGAYAAPSGAAQFHANGVYPTGGPSR